LLLDEPTNHLDIETRKVLESTLRDYPGTIIFVSHDRYFIDEIATQILAFKDKKITWYQQDYASYLAEIKNKNVEISSKPIEVKEVKEKPKSSRPQRLLSVEKYEEKINKIQLELEHLYSLMEEEEYYMDQRKMDELDDKIITLKIELSHLEEEYLLKLEQM
jgi:ATP-binding cassette subfamily F protein 3